MNTHELKSRLNGQAEAVCAHLFPNGKRVAGEWCVGSIAGEPGHSFKVHLTGGLVGKGKDWADGGGEKMFDLLDLWERTKNVDFKTARKLAHDFLGVKDDGAMEKGFARSAAPPKVYVAPDLKLVKPLEAGGPVFDYLTKTRHLDPATLTRYKIRQTESYANFGPTVIFPCFAPGETKTPDLLKYLAVKRLPGGKKQIAASPGARPHLFGWQAVNRDARDLHITEGEINALTLAGLGFNAVSLPMGANGLDWLEQDFADLDSFERIFIWRDMDEPGRKCAEIMAGRLGRERCYCVLLPAPLKDANEAFVGAKYTLADFADLVAEARTLDPGELRNAADFTDAAWEVLYPTTQATLGTEPPIAMPWRCRFGELTIWTGISGHGKTAILNHFAVHDAAQGEKCCLLSLEMPADDLVANLVRLVLGAMPTNDAAGRAKHDAAVAWLADKFWIVDKTGMMRWDKAKPLLEYAARRYGCTRFIIDSLGRLGVREDDLDEQAAVVSAIAEFATEHGHAHLVCHPKKQDDEESSPGKMSVRGSVAITDNCHNGFSVWRNKEKEQRLELCTVKENASDRAKYEPQPDAQLILWKNRKKGKEPWRELWFDEASGQYRHARYVKTRNYLDPVLPLAP